MALTHERRFAGGFCRDSGNTAMRYFLDNKKPEFRACRASACCETSGFFDLMLRAIIVIDAMQGAVCFSLVLCFGAD